MPLITDPDLLNQGVEVVISTASKTLRLVRAGNLSADGVTLKALYSFLKEEWKSDPALIKYPFPMVPITDEQFELVNGWNFDNTGSGSDFTPNLIRTGGWAVRNASGAATEMWAGIVTLGTIQAGGQPYYQQSPTGAAVNFNLTGAVNQAVQILSDPNGDGNYTDGYDFRTTMNLFLREQGNTYSASNLTAIGATSMSYQVYRFPLSDSDDLKVNQSDATVDAYGVTVTWHATPQTRNIGGVDRSFRVIINGNNKTAEQIYMAVQSLLRKNVDIDSGAGTRIGKLTNDLLYFLGDTLKAKLDATGGVYIDNFLSADTNRIVLVDNGGVERTFPFVSALTVNFGDNLKNDPAAVFRVFFSNDDAGDNMGRDFGTADAITVQDANGNPMAGSIGGYGVLSFSYDFDSNAQRGAASVSTEAPVTVVAIGLTTGQYVAATGTIQRSTSNSVTLTANLERNYANA